MIIIGLTGQAFAGKDTVGSYLAGFYDFKVMAFADPIRAAIGVAFGLMPSHFKPENKESVIDWIGKSPRQLMQSFGTEWGRAHVANDIWVRAMEKKLDTERRRGTGAVVITDVRFPNEAELVRKLGGEVWRIIRPDAATTQHASHASERSGDAILPDYALFNTSTIEELEQQADHQMTRIIVEMEQAARRMRG